MFGKLKDKLNRSSSNSNASRGPGGSSQQSYYAPPSGPPPSAQPRSGYTSQYASGPNQSFAPPPATGPPPSGAAAAARTQPGQETALAALRRYDTVILVDDSGSMEMYWDQTRDALIGVVREAVKYDEDGVDIYFFNSTVVGRGINSADAVVRLFNSVDPRRSTPTATAIRRITEPYMKALEASKANKTPRPKPMNLLCLTDGAPNRGEEPNNLIVDLARRLDAGRFPLTQFGLQFVQIGDDSEAREALQHLDDSLASASSQTKMRDIVDTVLFEGRLDSAYIIQALLGAINK